jgi:nucleoside-diphosphate-sugar epimerase
MTILVTGSAGYLGRAVIARLLAERAGPIRCLVRRSPMSDAMRAACAGAGDESLEVVQGNLLDRATLARAMDGVVQVVHLAAALRGAAADMFLNGVVATERLAEHVRCGRLARVVHVSSVTVYGLSGVPVHVPVTEDTALDDHPEWRDSYAFVKIWQERLLRDAVATSGVPLVVLRPGALYGRGGPEFSARNGLRIADALVQIGSPRLPITYIDNCADAIVHALNPERVPSGTYNVIDDAAPSATEYVRRYRRDVRRIPWLRLPYRTALLLAHMAEWTHRVSRGQIPLFLTPYRTRNLWQGHLYSTARFAQTGWRQPIPTELALHEAFADLRQRFAQVTDAHPLPSTSLQVVRSRS